MITIASSAPKKWKIAAELIKIAQGTTFSHSLIIKDDLVFQASHGRVNCTYIDIFLEENIIINKYEVDDESVDFVFVKKQLGKKYGYKEIATLAVQYLFGIKNLFGDNGNKTFICSEYVGKALKLQWANDQTTPLHIDEYLKLLQKKH